MHQMKLLFLHLMVIYVPLCIYFHHFLLKIAKTLFQIHIDFFHD